MSNSQSSMTLLSCVMNVGGIQLGEKIKYAIIDCIIMQILSVGLSQHCKGQLIQILHF